MPSRLITRDVTCAQLRAFSYQLSVPSVAPAPTQWIVSASPCPRLSKGDGAELSINVPHFPPINLLSLLRLLHP